MLAVTQTVQAALNQRCDAWHLRLDKFSFERNGGAEAKTKALRDVAQTYERQRGALQTAASARLASLDTLKRQHGERFGEVTLVLESRLLLHIGRASVLENVGLCCDRTTGLPLIPGTALKGVISTWACWEANQQPDGSFNHGHAFVHERRDLARRILGDNSATGSEHSGDIIFVGGFPVTPPALGLDIVNPHHRSDGSVETRLTPSPFLCIEPGTQWRFAFYVRPGATEPGDLLENTARWITEALTQLGIGAKTAAGYGRFRIPNSEDQTKARQQASEARAAEERARREAEQAAERARQQAAARAALASDYPQEATFKNRVLAKLTPGQLEQLRTEIAILQKPENAAWLEKLKQALAARDYKDIRKRLRGKDWFPPDWLPPQ